MSLYDQYNDSNFSPGEGPANPEGYQEPQDQASGAPPQFSNPSSGPSGFGGGNNQQPPRKNTGAKTAAIVAVCLAGGLAVGGMAGYFSGRGAKDIVADASVSAEPAQSENETIANEAQSEAALPSPENSFQIDEAAKSLNNQSGKAASVIYEEVSPSIVTVTSQFSAVQGNRTVNGTGNGSGIIIAEDGYILTNNHVVAGADSLSITTSDGEEHEAKLVGRDSKTDLAVLQFDNSQGKYNAAPIGQSGDISVGDVVYAIGNPLGEHANSMTNGMVSALNRNVDMVNEERGAVTMNFIQTTAPISPGNSGGALINDAGEVIGVTTAKSYGEAVEGIGYAIPIDDAKPIIDDLVNHGYVTGRPIIGITGQTVDEETAQLTNMPEGVYVVSVSNESPAAKAGFKVGDIIVSVNGTKVSTVEEINEIKNNFSIGDTLTMEIYRKGEKTSLNLVLDEEKPQSEAPAAAAPEVEQPQASPQYPGSQVNPDEVYGQLPEDLQDIFDQIFGSGY